MGFYFECKIIDNRSLCRGDIKEDTYSVKKALAGLNVNFGRVVV